MTEGQHSRPFEQSEGRVAQNLFHRSGSGSTTNDGSDLIYDFNFSVGENSSTWNTSSSNTQEASPAPKVWMITNCGSLLGKIIAEAALRNGNCVAACTRERHTPDLIELSLQYSDKFLLLECNVRDIALCQSSVAQTLARFGRIDVVVNTATKTFVGAFEEVSDWHVREQMELNFFGTINFIRAVLPTLRKQRSGHIINITGMSRRLIIYLILF